MSDLDELYREIIIDHSRSPRNFRVLEGADRTAEGFNPLCGDRVTLYVKLSGDVIEDVSIQGSGCAISTASASLLTESLKGKTVDEAEALFDGFREMVTSDPTAVPDTEGLGKLAVLAGVREFPSRVKCATLVWHTLQRALHGSEETASTE